MAQGIQVGSLPILALVYNPSQFGVQAVFVSIANLLSVLATARYEMAIVLPKSSEKAKQLVTLSLVILSLICVISIPVFILTSKYISYLLKVPEISMVLFLLPLSIIGSGAFQIFYNWCLRLNSFKSLAFARMGQNLFTFIFSILFGLFSKSPFGLIYGFILGQLGGGFLMLYLARTHSSYIFQFMNWKELKLLAIEYKSFPGINAIHALADSGFTNGLTFIISALFGQTILGYFSIAFKLLRIPLAFVGGAVAQVLFPQFAEMHHENSLNKTIIKSMIMKMIWVAIPFFLLLAISAPIIFSFFMGNQWENAGKIAQLLTPWLFLNFIFSPFSNLPTVLGKQKEFFYITLFGNLVALSVLYGTAQFWSENKLPLLSFSICCGLLNLYLLFWCLKILPKK